MVRLYVVHKSIFNNDNKIYYYYIVSHIAILGYGKNIVILPTNLGEKIGSGVWGFYALELLYKYAAIQEYTQIVVRVVRPVW